MSKKTKIYVGCALTYAPENFRKSVASFKDELRKDFDVLDFLWAKLQNPRDVDPKDVYEWDINGCVKDCDLFVAICDEVSIGLGYELGTAIEKYNKPVLAFIKRGKILTRLVEGITNKNFSLREYDELNLDAVAFVREKVGSLEL